MKRFLTLALACILVCPTFSLCAQSTDRQPLSPDFINFGYLQNNTVLPYLHYDALTHIAPPFVDFTATGDLIGSHVTAFQNRSSHLRLGGAADRAGTKVILCVRNNNFDETILDSVMLDPVKRTRLKNQIVALVANDTYCAGVNFDFEFSWGATTTNGITAFIQEVRAALPPAYELSVYTHAIYSSTRWNIPGIKDHIDYMLYSTYDWGSGYTPHANSDFNNCVPQIASYLAAGLPPEKMVLTWASYGRRWYNTPGYNQVATDIPTGSRGYQSQGFYTGLYDTTLRQRDGGPFTSNYERGDEIGWYTYTENGRQYTAVWDTPESIEMKVSAALSFPGDAGAYAGVRLGGVGWWSLMWASNYFHPVTGTGNFFDSFDPVANAVVARPPYYRHIDLRVQEVLKQPGQTRFLAESFEGQNDHWRDPNSSPDTAGDTDGDSSFQHAAPPAGVGRPQTSSMAARLFFDFENASGNRAFLRHEILRDAVEQSITDTNAALALVSANTRFSGYFHVAGNYSARSLRLALMDGLRQVEVSDPIILPSQAGWYTFNWDINDPAQINAWNTNEPALIDGNGILNTAAPGARDISFLGFILEGGGAGNGTIYFDEITYESHAPEGRSYVINEFRYSTPAQEYIEIHGPAGPFPADLRIVFYNSTTGAEAGSVSLSGKSIPASGLYVVGDPGVPAASGSTGFNPAGWGSTSNIPATAPGALQLHGSTSGHVYDSVVYAGYAGIADLARTQTRGVTREGYGWMGNVGPGTSSNAQPYTVGRLPDGADTNFNQADFTFMPATPGQPNGASGIVGTTYNFSAPPATAFQTYQSISVQAPASGIPASPGGGNVYRCVDTAGGGVVGVFGDGLTGSERGLDVTGQLYIPALSHPAQAVAVGIGGSLGSTFFASSPGSSGYDNGYWLVYENGTVNLNDGQPNHPQQFQLIAASNDNQDQVISTALGQTKTLTQLSVSAGTWVTFRLKLDKTAPATEQVLAQINGIDVYRGTIPAGGRTSGAFMVGHREAGGGVAATEGTWIDNLSIQHASPPARVENFELY